jgi:hypothetical protein
MYCGGLHAVVLAVKEDCRVPVSIRGETMNQQIHAAVQMVVKQRGGTPLNNRLQPTGYTGG